MEERGGGREGGTEGGREGGSEKVWRIEVGEEEGGVRERGV